MKLYEHRNAYRHPSGEVEGFVGVGSTKAKAKADAIDQMKRKCDIMFSDGHEEPFEKANVCESPSRLTRAELDQVQRDWRSGVRY